MVSRRSGYIPAHYEVAGFVPSSHSQFSAAQTVFIPENVKNTAQTLMKLEIALALLPGGGAANNLSQGQYVDGLIDAAGDIAGTLVAFGKVMKVTGKTCQIITRINQTVQVGTASYNFAQGAQMLAQGGHSWLEISAKTGEGFLNHASGNVVAVGVGHAGYEDASLSIKSARAKQPYITASR